MSILRLMKRLLILLLFARTISLRAEIHEPALRSRLGNRYTCAVVYSRHASGRPKLVITGIDRDVESKGELRLLRFPDSTRGRERVIDRLETDAGVLDIEFVHVVDSRDLAVTLHVQHLSGITVRVRHEKLIRIADFIGSPIDIDRDGIPELIMWHYPGPSRCGMPGLSLFLWNGESYQSDKRNYVAMTSSATDEEFETPSVDDGRPKKYVVRLYAKESATVFVDDERLVPGTPFTLENDCHTIRVSAPKGASAYAFVEEQAPLRKKRPQ